MKDLQALKDLALHAAKGTMPADAPAEFTISDVNADLRTELNALACDYNAYRRNKLDIFEIIQEVADEVVPNKVIAAMGQFAEIKQVAHGVRASFKQKVGKARAKQFITRVGLAGVYETFRLDKSTFDIEPKAFGGAAYIDFERFIAGDEDISDYMDIIVEGIADKVFEEVQAALQASVSAIRPANTVVSNTYDADSLFALCNVVRAYGSGAVIFASPEFVASMGADAIIAAGTYYAPTASPSDIESIHNTGYVTIFRGTPIVRLPQSFTDETNATKVISPDYAYIFPTGGEKVVKIVLEGDTIVDEYTNRDKSMEIQAYKKFGVGIATYYNWAVYYNASLS
ncbi:MAG: hypothetical protein PHQ86_07635 [Dehalococcoidales bacterium]|nr:hypothetical protein [Dehalococcoidales bacterium]